MDTLGFVEFGLVAFRFKHAKQKNFWLYVTIAKTPFLRTMRCETSSAYDQSHSLRYVTRA